MTVVNFLKLDKNTGMGCADERETQGEIRVYDLATKLFNVADKAVIGISGSISNCEAVIKEIGNAAKPDMSAQQILDAIQDSYKKVQREKFQRGMLDAYGLNVNQFPDLIVNKPDHFLVQQVGVEKGTKAFGVYLAAGVPQQDDFGLYVVVYPGVAHYDPKYLTIGSGSDRANIVIGDTLNNMQPEEREKISLPVGAKILMSATRSAWRNVGVGGRTQLAWMKEGKYSELKPNESNLLNNMLHLESKKKIEPHYVNEIFENVIVRGAKVDELLPNLESKLEHKELIRMFLVDNLQY